MAVPLNLDALEALCASARKERYDWWNQGAPDSADMRVASGEAEQTRDSLCDSVAALVAEVRRLQKANTQLEHHLMEMSLRSPEEEG